MDVIFSVVLVWGISAVVMFILNFILFRFGIVRNLFIFIFALILIIFGFVFQGDLNSMSEEKAFNDFFFLGTFLGVFPTAAVFTLLAGDITLESYDYIERTTTKHYEWDSYRQSYIHTYTEVSDKPMRTSFFWGYYGGGTLLGFVILIVGWLIGFQIWLFAIYGILAILALLGVPFFKKLKK